MASDESYNEAVVQGFNRNMLDRTVVAIPLLEAMKDVEEAEDSMETKPAGKGSFNAVIFLARNYPEGITGAEQQVKELLERVLQEIPTLAENNRLIPGVRSTARGKRPFIVGLLERRARLALYDRDQKEDFRAIERLRATYFDVIIDVNLHHPKGRLVAHKWVSATLKKLLPPPADGTEAQLKNNKGTAGGQYVFARMCKEHIYDLLEQDTAQSKAVASDLNKKRLEKQRRDAKKQQAKTGRGNEKKKSDDKAQDKTQGEACQPEPEVKSSACRAIHSIWPDFPIKPCITDSITTVKADAALSCFSTLGGDVTWAVVDSGIDAEHPHFQLHHNVDVESPLHRDFTTEARSTLPALRDNFGHGTHVAGIIAGEYDASLPDEKRKLNAMRRVRVKPTAQESDVEKVVTLVPHIRGMAPKCHLISLKVLDDVGFGEVSNVIAALNHVLDMNNSGRAELKIHGVNISLGYEIEPEWFACGESPICIEVDRVVRSGVPVIVAAGNTGYGTLASRERSTSAGLDITINDPGNAELAITVGSTHRNMPHRYGVSFFSSKGPTGDGRMKPDVVAPGEKILSCGTGTLLRERSGQSDPKDIHYVEDSGTSMAAPHVSGIIAGFLSVRREFIGKPERVKEILCATATDLKRDRYFQGAGLVDLMRAIQSV